MDIQELPLEKLLTRGDARLVSDEKVKELAASLGDSPLLHPIVVRKMDFYWEIIAGRHRFEAHKLLGKPTITCSVIEADDDHAELAMIDENLKRSELSPVELAVQMARRKQIYETLHPDGTAGRVRARATNKKLGRVVDDKSTPTFAEATSAATGMSIRQVQRVTAQGAALSPDAADAIKGTHLDTGAFLEELRLFPTHEQLEHTKARLAGAPAPRPVGSRNPIWIAYLSATPAQRRDFIEMLERHGTV